MFSIATVYLVADRVDGYTDLYASCFLHDTIEDARMTYNDVVKFLKEFKGGALSCQKA